MFCPNCGAQLPEGSVRCFQCDQPLRPVGSSPDSLGPHGADVKSERNWAALCHAVALVMFVTTFPGAIASLIVWLIKRNDSPFIDEHGKEAVNFQITGLLIALVLVPLSIILIGIPFLIALIIYMIIAPIRAAMAASNGEMYRYRLCIRLIQ